MALPLLCLVSSLPVRADGSASTLASAPAQGAALVRRAAQLAPVLLAALRSARAEQLEAPARCFDRALFELHGVQRQLTYHAERTRVASTEAQRARHLSALTLLGARVDDLARSVHRCLAEGAVVRHGTTVVEVVVQTD